MAATGRARPFALKADGRQGRCDQTPSVEKVIVVERTKQPVEIEGGPRRLVARSDGRGEHEMCRRPSSTPSTRSSSSTRAARRAAPRASSTRRAVTSPTSRRPHKAIFDIKDDDVYWCTADIGWITGHSYVVYGPLANGATTRDVRRHADPPGPGPLVGPDREVAASRSSTPLPRRSAPSFGWATSMAEGTRPVVASPARQRGRAHQSGGVDVVPPRDRREASAPSSTPGGRPRRAES